MPKFFIDTHVVAEGEIDRQGHVNNIVYVSWMQAVALKHSAACGWPMDRVFSMGRGWVVRSHSIRYKRPAFLGESVTSTTWVKSIGHRKSLRRYLFRRGEVTLAEAETEWTFVDLETGRPSTIPPEILAAFQQPSSEEEAAIGWR